MFAKLGAGQGTEVRVDERQQTLDGGFVSVGPIVENDRQVGFGWHSFPCCHSISGIGTSQ